MNQAVEPPGLSGFVSIDEGGWTIVAPSENLDTARWCLRLRLVGELIETRRIPARRATEPKRKEAPHGRDGSAEFVIPGAWTGREYGRGMTLRVRGVGGPNVIIKALRRGGIVGKIRGGYYGHDRLLSEMRKLEDAVRRGVPIPTVVFGASTRLRRGGTASLLATREFEGAVSLVDLLRAPATGRMPSRARSTSLARAGRAVRRAHDLGLDHVDLNIGNVLIAPLGRRFGIRGIRVPSEGDTAESIGACVIDLGMSRLGDPLTPGRRASNLIRLLRSAEKHLGRDHHRMRDAAAFMHGYLAGSPAPDRAFRRSLMRGIRLRFPIIAFHRIGWALRDWGT